MRKYLLIAISVLFIILIIMVIVQALLSRGGPGGTTQISRPVPTPFAGGIPGGVYRGSSSSSTTGGTGGSSSLYKAPEVIKEQNKQDLRSKLPIETDDFIINYSSIMDKIVVTRKTPQADEKLDIWAKENGYSDVLSDYHDTLVTNQTAKELDEVLLQPTKSPAQKSEEQTKALEAQTNTLTDLVHTVIDLPGIVITKTQQMNEEARNRPTPTPTPVPSPTTAPTNAPGEPKSYNGYVYYSQCHGPYDNYPLATGCTVCKAGCGPTTVAMILSTYVDKKYTPPVVVDIYKDIGAAACGTGLGYAKSVLSSHGVRTSDYIIPYTGEQHDIKEVENDLREYINGGWTIFVLASYPGGHYFWMTDITASGNVMAFDPYYGMDQTPPINENVRYPYPKYQAAFGVKRQ